MPELNLKPVVWMGNALGVLKTCPSAVQDEVGYALYLAQRGGKREGPRVVEVVSDHRGDTFRAVYTVRLAHRVYVLHAFQKKSKQGSRCHRPRSTWSGGVSSWPRPVAKGWNEDDGEKGIHRW